MTFLLGDFDLEMTYPFVVVMFSTAYFYLVVAFAVTVFCLYAIYSDAAFIERIDETVYGTSLVVATFSVVVIPVTMYNMSKLTFKVTIFHMPELTNITCFNNIQHA